VQDLRDGQSFRHRIDARGVDRARDRCKNALVGRGIAFAEGINGDRRAMPTTSQPFIVLVAGLAVRAVAVGLVAPALLMAATFFSRVLVVALF
jgi:hypothetical protein